MTHEYNHDDIALDFTHYCAECGNETNWREGDLCESCRCTWQCPDCGEMYEPGLFEKAGVCDGCFDRREEARTDAVMAEVA